MSTAKPTVFISYSHLDEEWKEKLLPHLKAFEQQGDLLLWHDRKIDIGADWYPEIREAVERARVAVCIITANFLASDFITKEEVPALLKRRETEDLAILPLLVSPCPWQRIRWLKGIQMFPLDGNCLAAIQDKTEQEQRFSDYAIKGVDQSLEPARPANIPAIDKIELLTTVIRGPASALEPLLPQLDISRLPETGAE
ncbi:MAG: toll/interleukin-1 receptor domain-containing protein, partial [Desulfobulbaceae bacterium]|nr:toll/interleukin-1 receptor domain-containing protein [Desulfobulbaceae bacterium]